MNAGGHPVPRPDMNHVGKSHAELKAMTDSAVPKASAGIAGEWQTMGAGLRNAGALLAEAMFGSEPHWQGLAADGMRYRLNQVAEWSMSTGDRFVTAGQAIGSQSDTVGQAQRAMPEVVPYDPAKMMREAWPNPFAMATLPRRIQEQYEKSRAAQEEAAWVVATRDSELAQHAASIPAISPPPQLADTDDGSGGGGGGGQPPIPKGPGGGGHGTPDVASGGPGRGGPGGTGAGGGSSGVASGGPGFGVTTPGTFTPGELGGAPAGSGGGLGGGAVGSGGGFGGGSGGSATGAVGTGVGLVGGGGFGSDGERGPGSRGGLGSGAGGRAGEAERLAGRRAGGAGRLGAGLAAEASAGGRGSAAGGRGGAGMGGMPMGGHGEGAEDFEHQRAAYLQEADPDGLFGTDEKTAPPVIGAE